jgi:hypothetical protein
MIEVAPRTFGPGAIHFRPKRHFLILSGSSYWSQDELAKQVTAIQKQFIGERHSPYDAHL